ncbi:MAG: hypothetical protein AAF587_40600 [Bacteroidota bacterium]
MPLTRLSLEIEFIFLLAFLTFLSGCVGPSTQSNRESKAQIVFEEKLSIIEAFAYELDNDSSGRWIGATAFLQETTGILTESPAGFFGYYRPTKNDYKRWSAWYEENKHRLVWEEEGSKIIVKE